MSSAPLRCSTHSRPRTPHQPIPLSPLDFLIGTWSAKTDTTTSSAGAQGTGAYTFRHDLNGHALVRQLQRSGRLQLQPPRSAHHLRGSQRTRRSQILAARALPRQRRSRHLYTISTPDAHTAIFNSQSLPSLPKFRLIYHLEGDGPKGIMTGKFQMAAAGSDDFHSYLEWSGPKQ